jgi:nitrate/nitrite-specific signal transduction histidine kinase
MRSRRRGAAVGRLSVRTALMAIVAVALGPVLALAWLSGEEDRRRAQKAALNRSYGVVDRVASEQNDLIDSSAVLMTTLAELAGRELLLNVAKHTQARTVSIELRERGGSVELVVHDDGSGFDPDLAGAVRGGHIGLASLSARAEAAGGDFTIESGPGRGSTVTVRVPSRAVG